MYHDNRGRLSAHQTLLPNMYHDNRGRLSAHHTLLPNMYHDNRGRLSAHHTLLPYMHHINLQTFYFVDPPEVHLVSDKVATDMNSSAILTCRSRAVPLPTFEWYNGTNRLSTGGRIAISQSIESGIYNHQSVLNITEVYPTDLGQYGCRVINMLGETTSNIYLTVKSTAIYDTVSFCATL